MTTDFNPDYFSPPGATLSDKIEEMGLSQTDLALRMGYSPQFINRLIKGLEPLTQDTAIRLEKVTRIPANFWNRREAIYQEKLAREKEKESLKSHISILAGFPVKELRSRGYLNESTDKTEILMQLLEFYGVANPKALKDYQDNYKNKMSARASCWKEKPWHLISWLRIGEIKAQKIQVSTFDKTTFNNAIHEIRGLTLKSPESFVPEIKQLCAVAGVAFVLVPEL